MTEESHRDRLVRLFQLAADLPPADREAFLARHCNGNKALRRDLDSLLEHDDQGTCELLEASVADRTPGPDGLAAGSVIGGRYKLLRVLGEGGLGIVYLAEQVLPVQRRVAVKLIKLGMDTSRVVARFEMERHALTLMTHPNIATVLDAGATEQGRPYFVMEWVDGVSIVDFCNDEHLGTAERLDLLITVCEAVHHAHQKGVIHRDLKPSNVLVMMQDGRPVPKVIDFGIAKATATGPSERTVFTEQGQIIGTPEYMSPEQADPDGASVDATTDIYSLGVMLYQLITGMLPFDPRTLRLKSPSEIDRIIREVDPAKPSTRVGTLGDDGPRVLSDRATDLRTLRRELAGELDWITMKAMDKARTQRYASAAELADDLRRHRRHEPVLAGPPGLPYRIRKYARRHRLPLAGATVASIALVAGVVGLTVGVIEARLGQDAGARESALREALDQELSGLDARLADRPDADANVTARAIVGSALLEAGDYEAASAALRAARDRARDVVAMSRILRDLERAEVALGRSEIAAEVRRERMALERVSRGR